MEEGGYGQNSMESVIRQHLNCPSPLNNREQGRKHNFLKYFQLILLLVTSHRYIQTNIFQKRLKFSCVVVLNVCTLNDHIHKITRNVSLGFMFYGLPNKIVDYKTESQIAH